MRGQEVVGSGPSIDQPPPRPLLSSGGEPAFLDTGSLFPVPYFLFPIPCSLFPSSYSYRSATMGSTLVARRAGM